MTAASGERAAAARIPASGSLLLAPVLIGVFFLSGAAGLIDQVVWVRLLGLSFGVTSYAVATVLCSFMAGLALGSVLAGRLADGLRRPLALYAVAEIAIGAIGVASPRLFGVVQDLYVAIVQATGLSALLPLSLLRFALAFAVLIVPTTLMGATLPLMVRSALVRRMSASVSVSLLYGVNTLGAMAGVLAAGFLLIGRYGLQRTLVVAALLNLTAGLIALALSGVRVADGWESKAAEDSDGDGHAYPARLQRTAIAVFGVSGALSLAYEIVWARVLAVFFDATTYGFTLMLAMVLLGIALGSWLVAPLIGRRWNWLLLFAAIEAVVGLLGLLAVPLLARMVPLTDRLGLYADPGPLGQFSVKFMTFVAALIVLPPMLLLGATFPIVTRVAGAGHRDAGRRVGFVYAANVCGAIAGSFIGGWLLLPALGVQASLLTLAALSIVLAVVLLWVSGAGGRAAGPLAAVSAAAVVGLAVLTAPDMFAGIFERRLAGLRVVFNDEGLENMATVADALDHDERRLFLNGQPQASTGAGVANFHRLIGHTGLLLKPEARRALVIGLGGGATAGAVARHPGVEVEIVELSSAVKNAAPYFGAINGDVLERPNVRLRVDDGRNFLLLTQGKYDLITADIIRPRHAGAGNLYAREYFELARDALAEDGVMVQWLEQTSERQYKLLMRTFLEVFPHVSIWANGSLLVGSKQPVQADRAALAATFADPELAEALVAIGLASPQDFLNLYTGDREEGLAYVGPGPVVSDDRPYVEYYRSLPAEDRLPDVSGFSRDQRKVIAGP